MCDNETTDLPRFLHGCFDWRENGYHWTQPTFDLLSAMALQSKNPWIVIASIIERAKTGDHSQATRLASYFDCRQPFALDRVSLLAFADIAPESAIDLLESALRGDDPRVRALAGEAAALAGYLRLVPAMQEAWSRASTLAERETIGYAISDLLEEQPGPIADYAGVYDPPPLEGPFPTEGLRRLAEARSALEKIPFSSHFSGSVENRHAELQAALGHDAVVWHGARVDIRRNTHDFFLLAKKAMPGEYITFRHKFEAFTGIDCRSFFWAFQPQKLNTMALLEEFTHSETSKKYAPGVRYFFGHKVPRS